MADLESRVASLEARMDIQAGRDPATLTSIDRRLEDLETGMGQVQQTVIDVAIKLEDVETKVGNVETRLAGVETRLAGVETRLAGVETKLGAVENSMNTKFDEILRRLPPQD
jgi:uncharacterized coiled-coil protein SlyX